MIIALATDDRSLFVFRSVESAAAYCEGIDVEDGVWHFWDAGGSPMKPVFVEPNERSGAWIRNGTYTLEPAEFSGSPALTEALRQPVFLQPNPYFESVESLQVHLASAKPVPQHGA
jgi:hypothetical protein